jgi:hypothetical protein
MYKGIKLYTGTIKFLQQANLSIVRRRAHTYTAMKLQQDGWIIVSNKTVMETPQVSIKFPAMIIG